MKNFFVSFIVATFFLVILTFTATAQTTTNLVVTPTSPYTTTSNITGVAQDSAPGFTYGSFKSGGLTKSDMYFPPEVLFNRSDVTIGEIESMSYWTKKGTLHTVDPRDWYMAIYTKPYAGDASSATWYGDRIGSEPYFSDSINDPISTWNQWSTDGPDNMLRFFESTAGAPGATFGSYTDPFWSDFIAANGLSGHPRAAQQVLYFSIQTGSAWAAGFTGQLDGLRIELTDGSVATINFEPFVVATSRDACKKDGWMTLKRANGSAFGNQGDCVSYVNTGN